MSLRRQRRKIASAFLFRVSRSESDRCEAINNFMWAAHVLLINVCGSTSEMMLVDHESLGDSSTFGSQGGAS